MSTTTKQPWRLTDVTEPLSVYAPAISLTILRQRDGETEILAGVRTEAANLTHADVVSVPTRRIALVLGQSWLDEINRGGDLAGNPDLRREVENLLARKLGVADALELGLVRVQVRAAEAWQGTSVIGESEEGLLTEDLTMFSVCVEVTEGAELFPAETASYRPIVWARTRDFLKMVESRDAGALGAGLDEIMVCVYGLCLETAVRSLGTISKLVYSGVGKEVFACP